MIHHKPFKYKTYSQRRMTQLDMRFVKIGLPSAIVTLLGSPSRGIVIDLLCIIIELTSTQISF